MGRLVVSMFSTLDGVMQGPGGPREDVEGGFEHSGWQAPFAGADSGAVIVESILGQDALLLGRKTYDIWVRHWPQARDVIGDRFNAIPKFVASRTLTDPSWPGTTVVSDVAKEVPALKDRFDEIHVIGSGALARSLLAADLVDRLNLYLYPIAFGSGKRLFDAGTVPAAFSLAQQPIAFPKGAVGLVYERAGVPVTGIRMED